MNEREPQKDMPVFTSSIYPYKNYGQTRAVATSIQDNAWLAYVRSLPGFQRMTEGGCGYATTYEAAKTAQDNAVEPYLHSYSWAYRKDTDWSYQQPR